MTNGWIKLHRQFRETSFYGQAIPVALWVECLLRASHEGKDKFIGREKVHLEPGQFVMGYREMGETIGCGTATVKAWMDVFESEGMVERSSNAKGTICKLKKWSEYQDSRTPTERARNADGTLTEPNKKNKNVKNERNTYDVGAVTKSLHDYSIELCKQVGIQHKVNLRMLDELVNRHRGLQLRVEVRKCVAWLADHGKHDLSTMRLTNWFAKASEIQKREENRRLDFLQAKKDPALAQHLKGKPVPENLQPQEPFRIDPALRAKLFSPPTPNA